MFLIFASSFAPLSSRWEVWTACFHFCRLILGRFLRPFSLMAAVCQHHRQATRSGTVINLHQFLSDKTIFCTCSMVSCYLATIQILSPHLTIRAVGDHPTVQNILARFSTLFCIGFTNWLINQQKICCGHFFFFLYFLKCFDQIRNRSVEKIIYIWTNDEIC